MTRIAVPILLLFSLFILIAIPSASATTITIGDIFSETDVPASIMINDVTDVAIATVNVTYDPSVIVVTDATKGVFESFFSNLYYANDGWVIVGAYQIEEGLSGNVKLAELTISPRGSYGDFSELKIDVETLSDSSSPSPNPIDAEVMDGFFYIGKNGDVNADRTVDSYDCVHIARGIVRVERYELKEAVAEVSGDGMVDAYDCVYLARHVAGISGYEELK